jgi:hypothetical protein
MFRSDIKDVMSGYRAFSHLFVKSYPIVSKGFEIETDMTIFALDKNLLVKSIPVDYSDRPEGSVSKLNTFRDGAAVVRTIFRLFKNYRPLQCFGLLALILAIIGGIFFISVFIEYLQTGIALRFPTLFVSLFIILASIQSLSWGLILGNVSSNDRRMFELHFIRIKSEKNSEPKKV